MSEGLGVRFLGRPHDDFVGVEIGCPDPACAGTISCPARGYRVARTLAEIAAAP